VEGYSSLSLLGAVFCVSGVQQAIRRLVDLVAGFSLRLNTQRTYTSRQRNYLTLCRSIGIDPEVPISERRLCAVCILFTQSHRITTLPGFVSAVNHYVLSLGHPPLPRGPLYDRVRAGLANWYGDTNFHEPSKAITSQSLITIHPHLDLTSFTDARDWCASLFAFYGLLRIKEYTCAGLHTQQVTVARWGVNLTIPFSKTSLIPTSVAIIRRDDTLCPVAAYFAYTSLVPPRLREPGLPFFLHSTSSATPLSDVTFTRSVRRWVHDHLREPPDDYSGHSFRRGGATAMQLAGVPESTIAAHGRWKSLAYRTYFDVQHSLELRLSATAPLRIQDTARNRLYEILPRLPPPP
jgi:hypothetical protein